MATPTARFVMKFDGDASGARAELDSLKAAIDKDTRALVEMQAAMQRLKGTAEVTRWEALPKDIKTADSEIKKLEKDFAAIGQKFEKAAAAGKVSSLGGIFAEGLAKSGEIEAAKRRMAGLKKEQAELANSAPVKLFEDLKASAEKTRGVLGNNQVALSRLGGTMAGAAGDASKAGEGMASLAEAAQQVPGPIGGIASKIQQLKSLGPAAAIVAVVVAVVALGVVLAKAAWEMGKLVIESADAARSTALLREASAVGSASARELEGAMLRVEGKTSATREAVSGLIEEYSRLRLSLGAIEGATSAITVATQAAGQSAGAALKGLIDRGVDTKRFWLGAFDLKGTGLSRGEVAAQLAKQMKVAVGAAEAALRDGRVKLEDGIKALDAAVEARFGEVARRQMLALPIQLDRAKKNLAGMFKGVDIEPFLESLRDVLSLLDETSETGQELRRFAKLIFQPMADGATAAMPLVEGFLYGTIVIIQDLIILALKGALALKKMFGDSALLKDIDLMQVGFALAGGAIGGVLGLLAGVAIIAGVVGAALAAVVLPILAIVEAVTAVVDYFETADDLLGDATEAIIDAIISAITLGMPGVGTAFKDMAMTGLKSFKSALGIASPSRVFKAEARWIPVGAAQGIEEGRPRVARALATLADPSEMSAPGGGGGLALAGGGTTNQNTLNYYGPGTRSDAQRFAGWFYDELETLTLAKGRLP